MINECYMSWLGLLRNLQANQLFRQLKDQIDAQESVPIFDRKIYYTDDKGQEHCLFVQPREFEQPAQPYPSWIWNESTQQWDPPVPRPTNPATEYDLLWNEDTQGWGLENMSLSKLNDNGTHVVERKYFDTWDNLIKYLHSIDQIKNVYRQIVEQEKLELSKRKIISPYHDRFICLKIIES